MNEPTIRASDVLCVPESDGCTLVFLSAGVEVARIVLPREAAVRARLAIEGVIGSDLAPGGGIATPSASEMMEFPPLELDEANVVVGTALRRVAPEDTVVGFHLFPTGDGRFDWSLEDAGPLGALYDSSVRQVLGMQAGNPRGVPMVPPIVDVPGLDSVTPA